MIVNLKPVLTISSGSFVLASGKGKSIKGRVSELSVSLPCRVRLFEKNSGKLIADVATDSTGNYEFDHLNKIKFFIVAHHPTSQFNAVIQDNVVPK